MGAGQVEESVAVFLKQVAGFNALEHRAAPVQWRGGVQQRGDDALNDRHQLVIDVACNDTDELVHELLARAGARCLLGAVLGFSARHHECILTGYFHMAIANVHICHDSGVFVPELIRYLWVRCPPGLILRKCCISDFPNMARIHHIFP
jgi:hypothetical protein